MNFEQSTFTCTDIQEWFAELMELNALQALKLPRNQGHIARNMTERRTDWTDYGVSLFYQKGVTSIPERFHVRNPLLAFFLRHSLLTLSFGLYQKREGEYSVGTMQFYQTIDNVLQPGIKDIPEWNIEWCQQLAAQHAYHHHLKWLSHDELGSIKIDYSGYYNLVIDDFVIKTSRLGDYIPVTDYRLGALDTKDQPTRAWI